MKRLLILIFLPLRLLGQNTIGLPDVINYSKDTYNAGLQSWDVKQDQNGIIYIANNEGLLSFDGATWSLFPLPNKTIVRSIEIAPDNKIYVGGQDELGYFSPSQNGQLQYHSIIEFIPEKDRSFGDVWDIVSFHKNIFFRSSNKIFKLTNEAIETFKSSSEWTYLGLCNGRLYAHDSKAGLMSFEDDSWVSLNIKSELPANDAITAILPIQKDSALITTLKDGLFILSKTGISKLHASNDALFLNERISGATVISHDWVALATNGAGVYIIDFKGNIIQSFSRTEGLQNNSVLCIFLDRESNLWLGLDNGIDLIASNSAIKKINPCQQDGSGYTAIIHNDDLFIGTSNGLFSVPLQSVNDLSFSKGYFSAVNNAKGQVWALAQINNELLLGQHEGAFVVKGNTAQLLSSKPGFWNFSPTSNTFPSTQVVAGNYNGLNFFNYANGRFTEAATIPNFNESSRFVAIDNDNNIWVSHPYRGIFKISKKMDGTYTIDTYTDKNGLPSTLNNFVYKIKNRVLAATDSGIFTYNRQSDRFEPDSYYQHLLGKQSIRYLKEDVAGNIWFIHEKNLSVIDLSDKDPVIIHLPELNDKMLSGFEFIYPFDESNIFLGGEKGFYHINYEKYKKNVAALEVQIRSVYILNKTDSLLFGGYFKDVNEKQIQDPNAVPQLSSNWKTIRFEFSSSIYQYQSSLEFSYRLKGFDDNWSDWTKRNEKEYTNLPAGNYTFEIKVRNNLGNESPASSYSFKILPPWYQKLWAYLIYLLILGIGIYGVYKLQQKKFKQQRFKYEEEQKKLRYIYELERNKTASELIALRNEKLEADIHLKNSELASNAMHQVKKGEVLANFREELNKVMKGVNNPQAIAELKKISKVLNEDDDRDKEWENFARHFDKVHSNFLVELKELHPTITPNEIKLSAYLRMNLSTKEIAQLMNISIRGVEIGRYRLRKKLQLSTETSLFDYLISIQPKT